MNIANFFIDPDAPSTDQIREDALARQARQAQRTRDASNNTDTTSDLGSLKWLMDWAFALFLGLCLPYTGFLFWTSFAYAERAASAIHEIQIFIMQSLVFVNVAAFYVVVISMQLNKKGG